MHILRLTLPIFMLAHASLAHAQDTNDTYGGILDAVIESVGRKDGKEMIRAMTKVMGGDEKTNDSNPMLDELAKQLEEQFKNTGDFLDADLYQEERFGARYSILTYVLNYAEKPIGLTIQMYKDKNGWRAMHVNFTPDIYKFANELRGVAKKNKS
jgi:hypothetical protein